MGTFVNAMDSITGYGRHMKRAQHILGVGDAAPTPAAPTPSAMVPAASNKPTDFNGFLREVRQNAPKEAKDSAPAVFGALAGSYFGNRNRVLGAIGGFSLGKNLPDLFDPALRRNALCNMGQTGAGIATALAFRRAPWWGRALAFGAGQIASGLALHFAGLRGPEPDLWRGPNA